MRRWHMAVLAAVLASGLFLGCDSNNSEIDWDWWKLDKKVASETESDIEDIAVAADVKGTIAEVATIRAIGNLRVSSWGIVIGLVDRGSAEVPPSLNRAMTTYLKGPIGLIRKEMGRPSISVSEFLEDPDTAIVKVEAIVPTGAPRGTRGDVIVRAWPGTSTQSLEGGVLLPIELEWDPTGQSGATKDLWSFGEAGGPIFVNPFASPEEDKAGFRQGRILNGFRIERDMPIRLLLFRPHYRTCSLLAKRINERFGTTRDKVADAKNAQFLELTIPSEWRDHYQYFLRLVMHLPLQSSPSAYASRTARVAEDIRIGRANKLPEWRLSSLAIIWEAMGPSILGGLRKHYASDNTALSYYAARAGLRMDDVHLAGEVIMRIAREPNHPYRLLAIDELGWHGARLSQATPMLRKLLNDRSALVRISAYEALLRRGDDSAVHRWAIDPAEKVGEPPAFRLDEVDTSREFSIYATQAGEPKVVLFGRDMPIAKTCFFASNEAQITVFARGPYTQEELEGLAEAQPSPEKRDRFLRDLAEVRAAMQERKTSVRDELLEDGDTFGRASAGQKAPEYSPHALEWLFMPHLAVYRRIPGETATSEVFRVPFRVRELVQVLGSAPRPSMRTGEVPGLGLTYGQVVSVLNKMCEDKFIDAKLALQPLPNVTEMYRTMPLGDAPIRPDE